MPIAGLLAVWCLILTIVGFGWFQTAAGGYGGTKEKVIGVGVLLIGLLLFFFRRIVQDKESARTGARRRRRCRSAPCSIVHARRGGPTAASPAFSGQVEVVMIP